MKPPKRTRHPIPRIQVESSSEENDSNSLGAKPPQNGVEDEDDDENMEKPAKKLKLSKEIKCQDCSKTFKNKFGNGSLENHRRFAHSKKSNMSCPRFDWLPEPNVKNCNEQNPKKITKSGAKNHLLCHIPSSQWPWKCKFCGMCFRQKCDICRHFDTSKHKNDPNVPKFESWPEFHRLFNPTEYRNPDVNKDWEALYPSNLSSKNDEKSPKIVQKRRNEMAVIKEESSESEEEFFGFGSSDIDFDAQDEPERDLPVEIKLEPFNSEEENETKRKPSEKISTKIGNIKEMSEYEKIKEKNIEERKKMLTQARIASLNDKKYLNQQPIENSQEIAGSSSVKTSGFRPSQKMITSTNPNTEVIARNNFEPQEMGPDLVIDQVWTIDGNDEPAPKVMRSGFKCDFCNDEKEFSTDEEFDKHVGEFHFFKWMFYQLEKLNYPYECFHCHGVLNELNEGVSHLKICYKFLKKMLEMVPEYAELKSKFCPKDKRKNGKYFTKKNVSGLNCTYYFKTTPIIRASRRRINSKIKLKAFARKPFEKSNISNFGDGRKFCHICFDYANEYYEHMIGHWKNIFEEMNPRPALSRNVCFVKFSDPNEDPCQFQGSSKDKLFLHLALTHQWIEKSNQILDEAYAQMEIKRRSSMLKKANANKKVEQKKEQLKNTIQKLELCKKLKDCQMKLQKSEEENGQLKLDLRDLEKNIGNDEQIKLQLYEDQVKNLKEENSKLWSKVKILTESENNLKIENIDLQKEIADIKNMTL